jgi:exoribonuclease-2
MERFWTLQYLKQHEIQEIQATVFKVFPGQPALARADTLPLVLPILNASDLPRGARVLLRLSNIDDLSLEVSGSLLHRLEDTQAQTLEPADEEDETPAGPLAIAVDVNETPSEETAP